LSVAGVFIVFFFLLSSSSQWLCVVTQRHKKYGNDPALQRLTEPAAVGRFSANIRKIRMRHGVGSLMLLADRRTMSSRMHLENQDDVTRAD
jgi:hypothetical protein